MRLGLIFAFFLISFSCKSRRESAVSDYTASIGDQDTGLRILLSPIDTDLEMKGSIKILDFSEGSFTYASGEGEPELVYFEDKLDGLNSDEFKILSDLKNFKLKGETGLSRTDKLMSVVISGNDRVEIPIHGDRSQQYVNYIDLQNTLQKCPLEFAHQDNSLLKWVVANIGISDPDLKIGRTTFKVAQMKVSSKTIQFIGDCQSEYKSENHLVFLKARVVVTLKAGQSLFVFPEEDATKALMLPYDGLLGVDLEVKNRVLSSYFSAGLDYDSLSQNDIESLSSGKKVLRPAIRWDLKSTAIIIEDKVNLNDAKESDHLENVISKGIKGAVSQLRLEFPELGNRIVLSSEEQKSPNALLRITDVGFAGLATFVFSEIDGSTNFATITLGLAGDRLALQRKLFDGFKNLGLIEDTEKDIAQFIQCTTVHELGHILGLRHNFAGFDVGSTGKPDFTSIMDYPQFLPRSLVPHECFFHRHDVASLKYLYADLFKKPDEERAKAIAVLTSLRFKGDMADPSIIFSLIQPHLDRSLEFIRNVRMPEKEHVLSKTPDLFDKVAKLYEDIYR